MNSASIRSVFSPLLCAALLLSACAPKSRTPEGGIAAVRDAARDSKDPAAWRTLTAYELLADGGDASAVAPSLERAEALGPATLRTHLLGAELAVLRGESEKAFSRYAKVLEVAPDSSDPLASHAAELALDALREMRGTVPDHEQRLAKVVDDLAPRAAGLGPQLAHAVARVQHELALKHGDAPAANAAWEKAGCVQEARVAGPFGPREMLGFDTEYPAEKPGPLADTYDLAPRRQGVATRDLRTRHCVLGLGRGVHHPSGGTFVARAEVNVKKAGAHVLRVETPNSLVVWVDDEPALRVDRRDRTGEPVHYLPLELTAGSHSLRFKVTSRHPNPALRVSLAPDQGTGLRGVALPDAEDPLSRFVATKLAFARGDAVQARERSTAPRAKQPTATTLVLYASVALADPLRDGELRRDAARMALRQATAQDPHAWYPVLALANLEAAEGRMLEAIESLRGARERWPEVLAIHLSLISALEQRGFVEAGEHALDVALERFPYACPLWSMALETERRRERVAQVKDLTEQVMTCNATKLARYKWLQDAGQNQEAAAELKRLKPLADYPYGTQELNAEIDLAMLTGDEARARELRLERAAQFPSLPATVLDATDVLLASDSKDRARGYLGKAIEGDPDSLYELRSSYEALGGEEAFGGFRLDGDAVLDAFEAHADKYTEPQVLVLDYTVVQVLPDGSSMDLTHNIMRVQSQEAVDALGEWTPPPGARVLRLSTIKADGRRLEPDVIQGKDSYSLPNLAPGDYVEFEFVRGASPSMGFPSGYVGDRFFFKSFEVPFHRSEMVVVLPDDVKPRIESRGDAPEVQRSELPGRQVLRFVAEESMPVTAEPGSVPMREYLPSVRVGYDASWAEYVESLRDLLADKSPHDPDIEAFAASLLEGAEDALVAERVARLHAWVTEKLSPTDELFGLAPSMWAARTGSRDRVLHYLLDLAGIESDLVMVRSRSGDHAPAELPDASTFGFLLLRVQAEDGPLWVTTAQRGAPADFIPEVLRGEPGLVLNAEAERIEVPTGDPLQDLHSVALVVTPQEDGSGHVEVTETLRGSSAVQWRSDLRSIAKAELESSFESGYVAQRFPGGSLASLEIEGIDDVDSPMVLRYEVEQPNLSRREGDTLVFSGAFQSALAPRFARMPERTTTMLVAPSQDLDLRTEVKLPKGAKPADLPPSMEVEGPHGARFEADAETTGQSVVLTRSLRLPFMRVTPEEYDAFTTFARAVDLAEDGELRLKVE